MKYLKVFIIVLLLIDGVLIFKFFQLSRDKKELNFIVGARTDLIAKTKDQLLRLQTDHLAAQNIESTKLSDSLTPYLKSRSNLLILRVHENNCNDCVKESLMVMKKIQETTLVDCLIFANYPSVYAFKTSYPNEFETFIVRQMVQDSATNTKPFLFFLEDINSPIRYAFVPEWDMTNLLEGYYNMIHRIMQEKK
jgi:hypothetical protein